MKYWTGVSLAMMTIFNLPSHAVPHHRKTVKNSISNDFIKTVEGTMWKFERPSSENLKNTRKLEFPQQFSEETDKFEKTINLDSSLRKPGLYDLNGPSEESALMEYYASLLVTSADPADRPILKEKLGEALEMDWSNFESFKNYCDKLADEVTLSLEIVDNRDLADYLYSLLK